MRRALQLAEQGRGHVEPNPLVGCVIVRAGQIVGEGFHQRFGGPHAEVHALAAAGEQARGSTLYVTLEPCCHVGKTPPCSQAVIAAGVTRVVAAMRDPFPRVAGGGFEELRHAGIDVVAGVLQAEAERLNEPYLKLIRTGQPWIIAKWAMTLDGKIATRMGHSRWISGPESRAVVQQLRGRVDAIVVGRRTAELDDPLLTARLPEGERPARIATRLVIDSQARVSPLSQLVRTAREVPVLVAAASDAPAEQVTALRAAGVEVLQLPGTLPAERLMQLFVELGQRRFTNILVEGGGELLGSLFAAQLVDEVHCFIAAKIFGSAAAPGPVAGMGVATPDEGWQLRDIACSQLGTDLYLRARR